jgi:DNA ligase-1
MNYTKASDWNGKDLKGTWEFTLKIDGVRAFYHPMEGWISRNGKPLYNLPSPLELRPDIESMVWDFEVYCSKPGRSSKENYKATIQCVRAKTKDRPVRADELYSLDPLDDRLWLGRFESPDAADIQTQLQGALNLGYEGLVLRQGHKWVKVKPRQSHDVKVTGIIEGTGKHKGRMGALMTDMGKVGTGFTDEERTNFWLWHTTGHNGIGDCPLEGTIIEVECMELTPAGKFRHPRFLRIRYDK